MQGKLALHYYIGKERLNCAQAVTKAFQQQLNLDDTQVDNIAGYGHGAAAGTCGALYASLELCQDEKQKHNILNVFVESAGSTLCRDVRRNKKLSCQSAVKLAADLLAAALTDKN